MAKGCRPGGIAPRPTPATGNTGGTGKTTRMQEFNDGATALDELLSALHGKNARPQGNGGKWPGERSV